MKHYSINNKSPKVVSRETFISLGNGDHDLHLRYAEVGSLQRIAESLETIVGLLHCHRLPKALDAIISMKKTKPRRKGKR